MNPTASNTFNDRHPRRWDGVMTTTGLGNFVFENYVPKQPLAIAYTCYWVNDYGTVECQICQEGPQSETCEVLLKWGSTQKYEHVTEVCLRYLDLLKSKTKQPISSRTAF